MALRTEKRKIVGSAGSCRKSPREEQSKEGQEEKKNRIKKGKFANGVGGGKSTLQQVNSLTMHFKLEEHQPPGPTAITDPQNALFPTPNDPQGFLTLASKINIVCRSAECS